MGIVIHNKAEMDAFLKEHGIDDLQELSPKNKGLSRIRLDSTTPSVDVTSSSPKDIAKVKRIGENLRNLAQNFKGRTKSRGALSELAAAVEADGMGYVNIKLSNNVTVHVRIDNHNANAENALKHGHTTDNISIVIKSRKSHNTFKAHHGVELMEYVYTKEAIAKDGNLLSSVAESLAEMMRTGEYVDKSGKAIVNKSPASTIQELRLPASETATTNTTTEKSERLINDILSDIDKAADDNASVSPKFGENVRKNIGMAASPALVHNKVRQLRELLGKEEITDKDITRMNSILDDIYSSLNTLIAAHTGDTMNAEGQALVQKLADAIKDKIGGRLEGYVERRAKEVGGSISYDRKDGTAYISGNRVWFTTPATTVPSLKNRNEPSNLDERLSITSSLSGLGDSLVFGKSKKWQIDGRQMGSKTPDKTIFFTYYEHQEASLYVSKSRRGGAMNITFWRKLTGQEQKEIASLLENVFVKKTLNISRFSDLASEIDKIMHKPTQTVSGQSSKNGGHTQQDIEEGKTFHSFPSGVDQVVYSIGDEVPRVIFHKDRGENFLLKFDIDHGRFELYTYNKERKAFYAAEFESLEERNAVMRRAVEKFLPKKFADYARKEKTPEEREESADWYYDNYGIILFSPEYRRRDGSIAYPFEIRTPKAAKQIGNVAQTENVKENTETGNAKKSDLYGFVYNGEIYLDETKLSPNALIHEYTHLWDNAVMRIKPDLWRRGKRLMRQTSLWKEIENDENYGRKWKAQGKTEEETENLIASEVYSRLDSVDIPLYNV